MKAHRGVDLELERVLPIEEQDDFIALNEAYGKTTSFMYVARTITNRPPDIYTGIVTGVVFTRMGSPDRHSLVSLVLENTGLKVQISSQFWKMIPDMSFED